MLSFVDSYYLYRIRVKRDPDAFGRLYDRHAVALFRYAFVKVSDRALAEELASETFLRFWKHLKERKHIQHVRAFLYQTLRNLIADHYREQAVNPATISTSVTFGEDSTSSDSEGTFSDEGRGARTTFANAELALLVQRIAQLKEDFQDVLHLRLIEGLGYDEIAAILGKTAGHTRVIYHRAVKALEGTLDTP